MGSLQTKDNSRFVPSSSIVSKSPFPTDPIASVHVSSKFFGHTMSLMSDRFGNLLFRLVFSCLSITWFFVQVLTKEKHFLHQILSEINDAKACLHVATRYNPYHPFDWYIFTYIWLIFYGKCQANIPVPWMV